MGKKSTKKTQLPNHQVMKELTNKLIKDLKILDSTLYSCRITIRMGGSSDVTIKLEDILDKKSIKLWNEKFPKRKSPEAQVFGDLKISYNRVVTQKEALYTKYAINFGVYTNVIPGSNLEVFLAEYKEKVVGTAQRELNRIKGVYQKRLQEYLRDIHDILSQRSIVSDQKLRQYEKQFPSLQNIEKCFGPVMDGPYQMPSIHDAAAFDFRLKTVIREAQLEKVKIAQINKYWDVAGQVEQVKDGILEKISEIRNNAIKNIYIHLQTIQEKNSFHSVSKKLLKDVGEIKETLRSLEIIEGVMGENYLEIASKINQMFENDDPSMSSEIITMIDAQRCVYENENFNSSLAA
jgi:hypothetical protein